MKTHREVLATVTSMNGQGHVLANMSERTIYTDAKGVEWASYHGGRRRIDRTRDGLAVLYLPAATVKATTFAQLLKLAARCPECERSNGPHYRGPCVH